MLLGHSESAMVLLGVIDFADDHRYRRFGLAVCLCAATVGLPFNGDRSMDRPERILRAM